ncbi:RNA helicase [Pelomonas sp. Root1217]|uniref:DEAD/DEAH box helicase n=1 Tax=Pelomonas sp. Root1217 TaxID=1736430 RepID=UPI00070A9154|nr:DEAD/DEAH box helicase [Pelomonas sp. Root1217]KQV60663.1 RNA helicase [Pelomonas sp. Root1217]
MSFDTLGLNEVVLKAVKDSGYENATDVQTLAIPAAIANKDLMVSARTGSGKTAAFILPALEKILAARGDDSKKREKGKVYGPKILVLAPTRELAMQVAKAAQTYGRFIPGLKVATVLGGMPYPLQIRQLMGPLDILIATPGRLIDHINSGKCVLGNVEMLVLDEADRMLDMGFIDDITMIAGNTPAERQTVMFSATFAGHVGRLAQNLLKDPQRIEVANHTDTHENIEQRLHWADNPHHKDQLLESILALPEMEQAVVFTSTQRDADWLADRLAEIGHSVAPLHGAMPQGKRNRVLQALRSKQVRVLVATDVAARGIDVPTISHVINYGLPMKAEDYVHRIGRTGRAGRQGLAITLGMRDDVSMIRRIQQFTTQTIPVQQIAGLEPKTQEPRIFPPRPAGSFDDRAPRGNFGGRPGFGNKPFRREEGGRPFHGGGKPFSHGSGGQDRGFAPRDDRGFAPQGDNRGFAPREDRGFAPQGDNRGFAPREDRGFAPREDRGFQPRDDRGFAPRAERSFQPAGKPSFGAKPAFGDRRPPSGPRKGGFGR